MPTRKEKLDALATLCENTVNAVESGVNMHKRFRQPATPQTARADRIDVMGDPAYYLEIHPSGSDVPQESATGIAKTVDHRYQITLLYGYTDHKDYASSSQSDWDALVEDAPNGLLPKLRAENSLTAGSQPVTLFSPEEATEDVTALSRDESAHILTFEITVRHVR